MAITLQLPESIERSLSREWRDLDRKALEAVAIEGYRQAALSQGQVGELLGLGFSETEAFLKAHGALLHYDEHDLDKDLAVSERIEQR
jgi:predicted HTH domain antitoxin